MQQKKIQINHFVIDCEVPSALKWSLDCIYHWSIYYYLFISYIEINATLIIRFVGEQSTRVRVWVIQNAINNNK